MTDSAKDLTARIESAYQSKTKINIQGNGTKCFLGNIDQDSDLIKTTCHTGIIDYDPAELVLVARSGTCLSAIAEVMEDHQQTFGFEPPFIDDGATLGGAIASGLAGPRRAYSGAARDFMLGARFINGQGKIITAGGKVIKNVAGFDLFRPMAGSMGTIGLLLDISLRVIPQPEYQKTLLHQEERESSALEKMNSWAVQCPSVSAAAWDGHNIRIRLSGSAATVAEAHTLIGGEWLNNEGYWHDLNAFKLDFFELPGHLWRISLTPMSAPVSQGQPQLIDWGGAQRWLKSDEQPDQIRERVAALGGHAECYSADPGIESFHPLTDQMMAIHRSFKASLDPGGILNPGRLYPTL